MKETKAPISTLERWTLLVFTLIPLLFFLTFFAKGAIREHQFSLPNRHGINFAVDDPVPRMPAGLHLLTVLIFLAAIRPRSFFVSAILAVIYAGLLLVSLYLRVNGESFLGGPIPGDPGFFQELYLKTWIWDYVALAYLVVLLPWLSSIIYRRHRRRSRKVALA